MGNAELSLDLQIEIHDPILHVINALNNQINIFLFIHVWIQ